MVCGDRGLCHAVFRLIAGPEAQARAATFSELSVVGTWLNSYLQE